MGEDSLESVNMDVKLSGEDIDEELSRIKLNREACGFIIASSFSMIVLLLSLVQISTIYFYISISFFTISVMCMFELFLHFTGLGNQIKIITYQDLHNTEYSEIYLSETGIACFYLGLIFLFTHYRIYFLTFSLISFIALRYIVNYIGEIQSFKKTKKKYDKKNKQRTNSRNLFIVRTDIMVILFLLIIVCIVSIFKGL